jgi:C1A family cysteine protease
METRPQFGMGWLRDLPDVRDFTIESEQVSKALNQTPEKHSIRALLAKIRVSAPPPTLQPTVNLTQWCSPIENQGALGSCTANAGVAAVEYFERRAFGRHIDASRLFLYKTTRNLLHWNGDTGAFLRTTMGALALFGVPPEEHWPYNIANFDRDPSAFCYAFAQNYQAIKYYRLDPPGTTTNTLLNRIKTNLAAGLPSIFGFTVYNSIAQANTTGKIPFPAAGDQVAGGHALLAVGYDDNVRIKNTLTNSIETTGAILIRNSWGAGWGASGYGYLPYEYVTRSLAVDWWSLLKSEWVETGQFGL